MKKETDKPRKCAKCKSTPSISRMIQFTIVECPKCRHYSFSMDEPSAIANWNKFHAQAF